MGNKNQSTFIPAETIMIEQGECISWDESISLFENMLDGFAYCRMIFSKQGKPVNFICLQVNDAFEKITGLKKEALVGKQVTKAIPGIEKENPELFEICGRVALSGKGEKFELFFKPLNKWFFISVYGPKKHYFVSIFENITEHKAGETLLKSSMERFMELANCLPEVVFETDLTGRLTYLNQKAFDLTGFSKIDLDKGVYYYDFIATRDLEKAKANFVESIMTATSFSDEYFIVRKDGSEFPTIIEGTPIKSENKTIGMRGLVIDVSDKRSAMDKLAFQAQLLESVGQAIIAIDKNRVIRYWNNGAKKLYGWSATEAIGHDIGELLIEHTQEETYEIYKRLAAGENWSSEIQVSRSDNSAIVPVIVNRYPIILENNEFIGSISIYTDITDQKKT